MNYPYARYLRFLVTKRNAYERIKDTLEDNNLVCPDMTEVEQIKDAIFELCPAPDLRRILNSQEKVKNTDKFLGYMKALEIHELWLSESNFKVDTSMAPVMKAIETFNDYKRREELNCFILNKTTFDDIEMCFTQKNYYITKGSLEVYKKLFFDIGKMSKKDWVSLLKKMDVFQRRRYLLAMNEDGYRLKYELGFKSRMEYSEALNDIFTTAYFKFRDSSKHDGNEVSHKNARSWAKTLMEAGDRKEKIQTGSIEDFTKAMQMEFTFDDEQFPSYSELK